MKDKNFLKSKHLGDKPFLWDVARDLREKLQEQMQPFFGRPNAAEKASKLIAPMIASMGLFPQYSDALSNWLYCSAMATNGKVCAKPEARKERGVIPEVPQDWQSAILRRINEIEAEVRKAQAVHEEILDLTDSLKASLDPKLDQDMETAQQERAAGDTIPVETLDGWSGAPEAMARKLAELAILERETAQEKSPKP
jgi:hypothetical protein